jgi:hypothetical protein
MHRMTTLWNRGLVGKLSVGLVGILVLCCIFGVIGSLLRRQRPAASQVPTPQAMSQAPPTQQLAALSTAVFATIQPAITSPTDLPTLTAVSIQPQPLTEQPTSVSEQPTPLPVAPIQASAPSVATAKLTPDERVAVLEIGQQLIAIGKGLTEIGRLASTFENATAWRTNVASQIAIVRQANTALVEMNVPPKIGALRTDVLNATSDCVAAMDAFTTVLDTNNLAAIRPGVALIRSCGEKMRAIQPAFEALRAQL